MGAGHKLAKTEEQVASFFMFHSHVLWCHETFPETCTSLIPSRTLEKKKKRTLERKAHQHITVCLWSSCCRTYPEYILQKSVYRPCHMLSAEECMVAHKLRTKQYIKNTLFKCSTNLFVFADDDRYTVNFPVFTTKSHTASEKGHLMQWYQMSTRTTWALVICENYYVHNRSIMQTLKLGGYNIVILVL